jgi:hypothetical protein
MSAKAMELNKRTLQAPTPLHGRASKSGFSALRRFDDLSALKEGGSSSAFAESSLTHNFNRIPVYPESAGSIDPASQTKSEPCPLSLTGPKACPFGGACHACPARIQTKLAISQPGDEYEQEADRVAEQVMRMPDPRGDSGRLRYIKSNGIALQRKCINCEEEKEFLQKKEADGYSTRASSHSMNVPSIVQEVLRTPGQPLDAETRAFFEPRFGRDFRQVRVHTDAQAIESAQAIHASAFTLGQDVVFAAQQYDPESMKGKSLLAHELSHVLQQSGARNKLYRAKVEDKRETIVATALSLENEHYLMGAAGQIPDSGGGINNRVVKLNSENHSSSIDVDYGKEKGGKKTHVCGGRFSKAASLPQGDPQNHEHNKEPIKYKWERISDGETVFSEACEGKRHFDCGGFVSYCYNKACSSINYPGPAYNLLTGWTAVDKDSIQAGDVAYRTGHVGLCISNKKVISALGKKWGVQKEDASKYSIFGYLECLKEEKKEEAKTEGIIQKKDDNETPKTQAFPLDGNAACYCDQGDSYVRGGTVACGRITCPNEKNVFAAWPNLNDRCRRICAEGPNVPRKTCGDDLVVSFKGNSTTVAVRDCGPHSKGRIIDLSLAAAKALDSSTKTCSDWGIRKVTITEKQKSKED